MRVFAHTWKDGILVALAVVQVALIAAATVYSTTLPLAWTLALGAGTVFLICTNFQCVAHNFIHNPFFVSKPLNRAFSVLNTLCIGVPQSLYRIHHLHHHKYNNDAKDPATGTTHDVTSTFRFGKNGGEETIVTYALLGFFRSSFEYMWNQAKQKGLLGLVIAELIALAAFVGALAAATGRGFVFFYLPVWYLGHVAAMAENYVEHHGAIPGIGRPIASARTVVSTTSSGSTTAITRSTIGSRRSIGPRYRRSVRSFRPRRAAVSCARRTGSTSFRRHEPSTRRRGPADRHAPLTATWR